jgi:signal transduction histidine kinase
MRLADFIDANVEPIIGAAEAFAATLLPAAGHLDQEALRNHLPRILKAVALDLRAPQTAAEELQKSEGRAPHVPGAPETAAQTHALLRAHTGFDIKQLVAEYRALRAGVLRLWVREGSTAPLDAQTLADMIRFNEAIDQAVAESVVHFTTEVDRWRHMFLGVLGHDLRSPLNTILLTSQLLSRLSPDAPVTQYTARLMRSGERMRALLDDLLDYSRGSLGLGIAIHRAPVDLAAVCNEEIDLLRSALPGRSLDFETEGPVQGSFDGSRIREVLANLVLNAAKYGSEGGRIRVRLSGDGQRVTLCVVNEGASIPGDELGAIFEPLRRGALQSTEEATELTSLGLGLFIVREIARAHGGEVDVVSAQGMTTFSVTLSNDADVAQPAG